MKQILTLVVDKISSEKKKQPFGPIQISSNNQIIAITKETMPDGSYGLSVKFRYLTKYLNKDIEIGTIDISGKVYYNGDRYEQILELWKNEKKMEPADSANIINVILSEASVTAVIISNQIKLPPPIPLPRAKAATKKVDTSYID
ncbi:MAG: hypothetical protein GQ477_02165 [Nanohaloarchaea archaeon]|nr:hypothetical protein [Candidatus Nanohaloarchaea archaeon]